VSAFQPLRRIVEVGGHVGEQVSAAICAVAVTVQITDQRFLGGLPVMGNAAFFLVTDRGPGSCVQPGIILMPSSRIRIIMPMPRYGRCLVEGAVPLLVRAVLSTLVRAWSRALRRRGACQRGRVAAQGGLCGGAVPVSAAA